MSARSSAGPKLLAVALALYDVWAVIQLVDKMIDHRHGTTGFWVSFGLIAAFHVGLIWFTMRVARRAFADALPSGEGGGGC